QYHHKHRQRHANAEDGFISIAFPPLRSGHWKHRNRNQHQKKWSQTPKREIRSCGWLPILMMRTEGEAWAHRRYSRDQQGWPQQFTYFSHAVPFLRLEQTGTKTP